jgi:hypothetical protein
MKGSFLKLASYRFSYERSELENRSPDRAQRASGDMLRLRSAQVQTFLKQKTPNISEGGSFLKLASTYSPGL